MCITVVHDLTQIENQMLGTMHCSEQANTLKDHMWVINKEKYTIKFSN